MVFSYGTPKYNPQKIMLEKPRRYDHSGDKSKSETTFLQNLGKEIVEYTHSYPRNLLYAATDGDKRVHPTQKPVAIFEYLIKTYTNPGDTVLDNCAGSGTTGEAAERQNRHSILIERESKYCEIIKKRLTGLHLQVSLFE